MSAPERLYDVPDYDGGDDYLPDDGMEAIAEVLLPRLHPEFDVPSMQAHTRSVTATMKFPVAGPEAQAEAADAVFRAAAMVRCLYANLAAARAALRAAAPISEGDKP